MHNTRFNQTWLSNAISWVSLALIGLVPLMIGPSGGTPIAKMVTVNIGVDLLLVLVGWRFIQERGWSVPGWWRLDWPTWFCLGWLVVLGISTVVSLNSAMSFWGSKQHGLGYVTYWHLAVGGIIISRIVTNRAVWEKLLFALTFTTLLVSLHALGQSLGWDLSVYQSINRFSFGAGHRRAFATFGNPIHLTLYLTLVIPLLMSGWINRARGQARNLIGATIGLAILATFASVQGHAGAQIFINLAYVSLFGGLIGTFWIISRRTSRWLAIGQVATGLIFGLVVASSIWVRFPGRWANITSHLASLAPQSVALTTRYANWKMARQVSAAQPWLGYGLETYQDTSLVYYPLELTRYDPIESHIDRAHQWGLDWLVTTGWLGWISYLLVFGVTIVTGWHLIKMRVSSSPSWTQVAASGIVISLITYLTQLWLNFPSQPDLFLSLILIGLVGQFARVPVNEPIADRPTFKQPTRVNNLPNLTGQFVILGLGLVGIWFFGVRFWAAELLTKTGINRIESQANQKNPDFNTGLRALTTALHLTPMAFESQIFLAEGQRRAGQFAAALATLEPAKRQHPNNRQILEEEIQIRLSWAEQEANQRPTTKAFLQAALASHKYRTPIYDGLIQLAAIQADLLQGQDVVAQAREWAPNHFYNWGERLGIALAKHHQSTDAITLLADQSTRPLSAEGLFALGYAYVEQKNYAPAQKAFETCTSLDINQVSCWLGQWNTTLALGQAEKLPPILVAITRLKPELADQLRATLKNLPITNPSQASPASVNQ